MSSYIQCKAITKSTGTQCKREAVKDGYCMQHYNMFVKNIKGNKSPKKINDNIELENKKEYKNDEIDLINNEKQVLIPDLLEHIVSEYLDYEDFEKIENKVENLKINPKRIKIEKNIL
jgi:hypothetical protein